jgi:hypothetical protein
MWRSGLVKAMIEKEQSDQILTAERLGNKNWYSIDQFEQNGGGAGQLATETVAKFQLSHFDEETQQFLDASFADSNRLFLQLWYRISIHLFKIQQV